MRAIKLFKLLVIIVPISFLVSCASSQETQTKEDIYIFDEIPTENKVIPPTTGEYPDIAQTYYVVQIGAFTTKKKAESFAEIGRRTMQNEIGITYSERVNLYVVQLIPFYKSRQEAEIVRDNLRQIKDFSDAWIVTINK